MSYLKPDYNYVPPQAMYIESEEEKKTVRVPTGTVTKEELRDALKDYANTIEDIELYRYYGHTSLAFRTNINVFDSVSYFKKFTDGFLSSLKKNFPELNPESLIVFEKSLIQIEKIIADLLKDGNVENKFLLALTLGMLEGMLNYENY